jgi:hypothetical protein
VNKLTTLTNHEIDEIMRSLNMDNFIGCHFKDICPKLKKNECLILNLDDSTGPGTHWCSCFLDGDILIYFDSYGFPPPKRIKRQYKKIRYSDQQLQDDKATSCGWWCCYMLYKLSNGSDYYDVLYSFDINNLVKNEQKLKNIFT